MSDWKLKILSGHYFGSELELASGRYRCGCDDNDDLVFQEPGLLPGHFELDVTDDMVRLIRLRKDNKQRGLPDDEVLEQGALVVIGDLQFSVANGPVTWPEPLGDVESLSDPEPVEPAEPVPEVNDSAKKTEPESPTKTQESRSSRQYWVEVFREFRIRISVIGACVGLLMLVAAGAMTNAQPESSLIDRGFVKTLAQMETLVAEIGFPDVHVTSMGHGVWVFEGYVNSSTDMNKLKQWIETNGLDVSLNVKITDELVKGTEIALEALGYSNVSVKKTDLAGHFILTGNVSDEEKWKLNRGRLQVDVPGILAFEDKVVANTQLARTPFPNLVVRGIYMGKTPFFVLSNGEKYFVGSQLEYGYRVEDIASDMLQLRRGDKLIQYRLGVD
ncbi:MAG: type III secretion system inner membrane ring subunit SctD [Reinekea sp.]